jgi:hypothetical protein
MHKTILTLVALLAGATAFAGAHESEAGASEASSASQVRVAGGSMMEHAGSSKSDAEWAEQRPDFERLKPRNRDD